MTGGIRGGLHVKLVNLLTCAVIAGLATAPTRAHAEPADAPNIAGNENMPWNKGVPQDVRATAREAFLEGNRLFKIPVFSRAVEKYAEAIDRWKHPAFYFNLAIAQINLGAWLEARDNLERAMKYGPEPLRADRFEEARKQLIEVEHHLGRIRVSCPTQGAEVRLDGVALFNGPGQREVWVAAQPHEVTAKKPEYATQARQVAVAPGAQEAVDLSLRKLVEDRPWATWKPWLVVGTGIAVAAAAGVVHGFSAHDFNTFDAGFAKLGCAATGCSQQQIDQGDPHLSSRLNRARLEQRIAVGGYIAGGAIIAAGAVLVYMNRPHLMERDDTSSGGVTVVPVLSSGMTGVAVTVSR
jgi:hypothetical protein